MAEHVVSATFNDQGLQQYTIIPGNRIAPKNAPKCSQCQRRYCTYNDQICLKCHNKTQPLCQGCHKKKFVGSNNRCYDCSARVVTN